ncbi:MAG: lamin tail domain-containing protein [Planctomycetota bacterium]|nr:lamin tail domain-containing protein [Planctomycetota bacterium]
MNKQTRVSRVFPASGLARLFAVYFFTLVLPVFFPVPGRLQALTISEVMYHSSALEDRGDEYIELYNENIDPLDLSGYSICNGINFVFPRGTYLDGHAYLVVCADEAVIRDRYGITNTIGNWVGSLDNSGERIEICNTGGRVVGEMSYNDRGKWPVGADGTGHSLALKAPFLDFDDADSWRLSRSLGGTPGRPNGPSFAAGGAVFEPPANGMDSNGFILTWLVLGPYTGASCDLGDSVIRADWLREAGGGTRRQTDMDWRAGDVVNTSFASARSTGLHRNSPTNTPTVEEYNSFGDTIDFNESVWPPDPENVMGYAFTYVDNVTNSNLGVTIGCASDDAIAVMINGSHVHVNDACRGVGNSGQVQDTASATLRPGKNLVTVKVFENGGGWSFRLRFQQRLGGAPITDSSVIQVTTDVDAGLDFDGNGEPIKDPGGGDPGGGDPEPEPLQEPGSSPVLINEGLMLTGGARWIELYNRSGSTVDLSGYYLTDDPANLTKSRLAAGTSLASGAFLTFTDTELGLDFSVTEAENRVFVALVDDSGEKVLDAYNFEPEFVDMSEARIPDGDDELEGASVATRGAANRMEVNQDIVINEIMYHPIGDNGDKEFIELYNRGNRTVDISGWELNRGLSFAFPEGTRLPSDTYLVIARNPRLVEETHGLPADSVLGPEQTPEALDDFNTLRDSGERQTLKDTLGRTVDTVRYYDGGDWPRWADGMGSSMELIDPYQDNRFGAAWDASDDSDKAEVEHFSYVGRHGGGESELHVLLLTRGMSVVDNLSIVGGAVRNDDTELIADDEIWRYFRGTQAPPANWRDRGFDDSDWESGRTGIGYGDGDDTTVLDDMRNNYLTVFCRKTFNVTNVADINELILSITVDDGFYAYINGVQVASYNVNSPAWDSSASGAGEPTLVERTLENPGAVLRLGENVLAVQVHNGNLTSSDLSFIPRLVDRTTTFVDGSEQLTNGSFNSNTRGWMLEGTHWRSGRTTIDPIDGAGSLKVIAAGRGDNKVNRIETPSGGTGLSNLNTNEDLQISFDARWVIGSQTILTHGYQHAMAKSHRLAVPENLGTPGRINSVTLRLIDETGSANLGPVIRDVWQDPPVPGANESVTVYARVNDSDGVRSVRLRYSSNNPSSNPSSANMTHRGGDLYSGTIPGRSMGTKIVFFLTAADDGGREGRYPVDIEERTHPLVLNPGSISLNDERYLIYRHTERLPATNYHSYRFWMTNADESRISGRRQQSNDLVPGTFVYGGSRLYYGSATRFSGSPFARGGWGGSFRAVMPRDDLLHERIRKMNLDNHHGSGNNARERISHYLIRHNQGTEGTPYSEIQTMVRWQLNDRTTNTLEHTWVPDVQYLSLWFPGDDDGDFFEVDDRFVINDSGGRAGNTNASVRFPPSSPRSDGNGENKENYRWFFGLRAKNGEDDFSSLIELARVMDPSQTSNAVFDEVVWDIVNVEEMLRIWAVRLNTDDWDTWGANRGKNCYLYRPAIDGRFCLLAWDMELTYGSTSSFLIPSSPNSAFNPGGFSEVHRLMNRPAIKRIWYGILDEMVNGADSWFTSARLSPYMQRLSAIGMGNTNVGQPGGYIDQRASSLRSRISSVISTPFRITTNSGRDFSVDDFTVALAGNASVRVGQILVNEEYYETDFPTMTTWRINDIQLHPGLNELNLIGFDRRGNIVGTESISVTNTNAEWDAPVISRLEPAGAPAGDRISIVGTGFHDGVRVFFGDTESSSVSYDEDGANANTITARVPEGVGLVRVTVRNVDAQVSNAVDFNITPPPAQFIRGDSNGDGRVDVSDAVKIVFHLFRGAELSCADAADINDDEALNITDAVRLLDHMFRGGPAPASPYPALGRDPAGDGLDCSN